MRIPVPRGGIGIGIGADRAQPDALPDEIHSRAHRKSGPVALPKDARLGAAVFQFHVDHVSGANGEVDLVEVVLRPPVDEIPFGFRVGDDSRGGTEWIEGAKKSKNATDEGRACRWGPCSDGDGDRDHSEGNLPNCDRQFACGEVAAEGDCPDDGEATEAGWPVCETVGSEVEPHAGGRRWTCEPAAAVQNCGEGLVLGGRGGIRTPDQLRVKQLR